MYSLSKYILFKIIFFNNHVLPHSLGPDITHLIVSGNEIFLFLSISLSLTLTLTLSLSLISTLSLLLIMTL